MFDITASLPVSTAVERADDNVWLCSSAGYSQLPHGLCDATMPSVDCRRAALASACQQSTAVRQCCDRHSGDVPTCIPRLQLQLYRALCNALSTRDGLSDVGQHQKLQSCSAQLTNCVTEGTQLQRPFVSSTDMARGSLFASLDLVQRHTVQHYHVVPNEPKTSPRDVLCDVCTVMSTFSAWLL